MPSTLSVAGFKGAEIHQKMASLTNNLVNIKDETGHFLLKLPDYGAIDTKRWNDWGSASEYMACMNTGLFQALQRLSIIGAWFAARLKEGTTKNINTTSPFLTPTYPYEKTSEQRYLPWLESWAEWAMNGLPRTKIGEFQHTIYLEYSDDELWDDTSMMTAMPLAKVGLVLKRPHYVEEAK